MFHVAEEDKKLEDGRVEGWMDFECLSIDMMVVSTGPKIDEVGNAGYPL